MKVLNFGSLNIDHVYQVDHFVKPGETLSSRQLDLFAGGKGLNQSVALARAGARVSHAGAVGADGRLLTTVLSADGVDVSRVCVLEDTPTGHAVIQVDAAGQNSILLFGGANRCVTEKQIDEALQDFGSGDILILQNEINGIAYLMKRAQEKGLRICLNPSPCDEKIQTLPLDCVDVFLLNEVEAAQICGDALDSKADLLEELAERFPKAEIVLTLGEKGVRYAKGKFRCARSACRVKAVDTTAAGDTFTGYYIACISRGCSVEEALRLATLASGIAVTRNGAQASIPYLAEVEQEGV